MKFLIVCKCSFISEILLATPPRCLVTPTLRITDLADALIQSDLQEVQGHSPEASSRVKCFAKDTTETQPQ